MATPPPVIKTSASPWLVLVFLSLGPRPWDNLTIEMLNVGAVPLPR